MKKIDINISRTLTINTGNYESIKPSVNLTVKDIDADQAENVYGNLQTIMDVLIKFEVVQATALSKSVNRKGIDDFCKDVLNESDNLGEEVNKALSELSITN